jgi:hypothetical protein
VRFGREFYEEAMRLHEEHARHARQRGDQVMARRADERAERARQRAAQHVAPAPDQAPAGR